MPDNNIRYTKYYFCLDDSSTSLILMTHFVSTIRSMFFVSLLTWWFIDMVFTIIKPPTSVRIKAYFYCVDLNATLMQIFNLHNVSNYGSRNIGKNIKMNRNSCNMQNKEIFKYQIKPKNVNSCDFRTWHKQAVLGINIFWK